MAYIDTDSQDALLTNIKLANKLLLCSSEPATYAAANTAALAEKTSPTLGAIESYTGGRRFQIAAITDGTGTAAGTATHWALIDTVNERLKATGSLTASEEIASGATVQTAAAYVNTTDAE